MPSGFSLGVIGAGIKIGGVLFPNIGAVLQAYQNDSDVRILSTPQLLTLDNEDAEITVGQNVPYVTRQDTTVRIDDQLQQLRIQGRRRHAQGDAPDQQGRLYPDEDRPVRDEDRLPGRRSGYRGQQGPDADDPQAHGQDDRRGQERGDGRHRRDDSGRFRNGNLQGASAWATSPCWDGSSRRGPRPIKERICSSSLPPASSKNRKRPAKSRRRRWNTCEASRRAR